MKDNVTSGLEMNVNHPKVTFLCVCDYIEECQTKRQIACNSIFVRCVSNDGLDHVMAFYFFKIECDFSLK